MKYVVCGLILVFLFGCSTSPVPADAAEELGPLQLVEEVDIERYAGLWYEIARFQHSFEKRLVGATAEYTIREDGQVDVVNSGFRKTLDGRYTEAKAVAWVPDPDRPAALKVKFFNLFTSDYLIFGLDQENYEWALVGNDSRRFLWLLARTPEIDEELYRRLESIAEAQGFPVEEIYRVPQKPR